MILVLQVERHYNNKTEWDFRRWEIMNEDLQKRLGLCLFMCSGQLILDIG